MNKNWSYRGKNYTFDISNPDCLGRIGSVFPIKDGLDGEEELTPSEKAERICAAVRTFFTALFDDDGADEICGDGHSAADCTEAYLDFIAFLNVQLDEFARIREAVEQRYTEKAASLATVAD